MHRESSTSLVRMCLPISYALVVGGIMQLVVQITIMYAILMGMTDHVRTTMSSVM